MIKYNSGSFGFQLLFRFHGSAVFKSVAPALISSLIYLLLLRVTDLETEEGEIFEHPYPIGVLISALTFLLAFRANFSYNRYWEAVSAVHQMHSKWIDVGMELAAFHLQSSVYNARKPPTFGRHPELKHLQRERERLHAFTMEELETHLDTLPETKAGSPLKRQISKIMRRKPPTATELPITNTDPTPKMPVKRSRPTVAKSINATSTPASATTSPTRSTRSMPGHRRTKSVRGVFGKGNSKRPAPVARATSIISSQPQQSKAWEEDLPPLFLQEAAHLLSLLSAVAFSTLRNDLEKVGSPLTTFFPGADWPHVDPDNYDADVRRDWSKSPHRSWTALKYLAGTSRSPKARALYNHARPFRVVGGVSDAEVQLLQAARGPLAKVALCSMWLQEFITREYLAGSLGKVAPPIISRLYQFASDGMLGYNHARKVAYIPFPFPHAQITSLFVLVVIGLMPVLMLSYLTNNPFGFVINFLTVMSFTGLHEVARELESPFDNVPNDVPLNNFQAQFNEALMAMFAGFHPDAFWEVTEQLPPPTFPSSSQLDAQLEFVENVGDAKRKQNERQNQKSKVVGLPTIKDDYAHSNRSLKTNGAGAMVVDLAVAAKPDAGDRASVDADTMDAGVSAKETA